ncbi:hypothetical protein AC579_6729 [Pseudocercospora musae]|uniref:Uncharacterized protein n=1 Tax=Pseudocercospora musae TaxID=113226 RepID=A0A139H938_9PEZI|nr:hypothetical protein AC579_6729 [Pseudocercospora musae]
MAKGHASMADTHHSLLHSDFPVLLPDMPELRLPRADFEQHVLSLLANGNLADITSRLQQTLATAGDSHAKGNAPMPANATGSAFMTGLLANEAARPSFDERDGKMLTDNSDVTYATSGAALLDLFYHLQSNLKAKRLKKELKRAWHVDPDATLKIIWNARSIHIGKGSREPFYRAIGWLYENHPATLLVNLPWLVRPVIQKQVPKPKATAEADPPGKSKDNDMSEEIDYDSDFTMLDEDEATDAAEPPSKKRSLEDDEGVSEFDVKYGVSHGYWKDLLNILALAVRGELRVGGNIACVTNPASGDRLTQSRDGGKRRKMSKNGVKPTKRDWTPGRKQRTKEAHHDAAVAKLNSDPKYKALHLTIARLFAHQLQLDIERLQSGRKADIRSITLCAKWAPSNKGSHDKQTCIVSSIAETLYSFDDVCPDDVDPANRTLYLKHARNAYQKSTLSKLRKHLDVVERKITAETFDKIDYARVPSLAMQQYTPLFIRKDFDHFDNYLDDVASGKAKISGAVLLPSTMVASVLSELSAPRPTKTLISLLDNKKNELQQKTVDEQWNTLVQRVKDSGALESSIAVCDVSFSMFGPELADGTFPVHSAIGLSLLIAEVTKPPFGGAIITFSQRPEVMRAGGADDSRTFREKVRYIEGSAAGMNTDFEAVFIDTILPMAVGNKLKQEDMVKQLFVFSDMQFDSARGPNQRWSTSFERIKKAYAEHGYVPPKLVFWNLAGHENDEISMTLSHDSPSSDSDVEDTPAKPVTADEENTALVSGYSQGQLKMFLENGRFTEEEEVVETKDEENGEVVVEMKQKQPRDHPLANMYRAIGHKANRMLKVVD